MKRRVGAARPLAYAWSASRLANLHKLLLQRYTGSPPVRVDEGTITVERSDQRYCSDGFGINCDNGEKVRVTFSLDCCDHEAIAFAAATAGISGELVRRHGADDDRTLSRGSRSAPSGSMAQRQWFGLYRSRHACLRRRYRHDPLRTPYRSPRSNGMAESFVKTSKRDYVRCNPTPDPATVLARLCAWFTD